MSKDEKKLTSSEAKKVIEKEQIERVQACQKELQEILTKYNCIIEVGMTVTQLRNIPIIQIIAKQDEGKNE